MEGGLYAEGLDNVISDLRRLGVAAPVVVSQVSRFKALDCPDADPGACSRICPDIRQAQVGAVDASRGIYVYTGGAPASTIVPGTLVAVQATVIEYVPGADPPQPPLTELTNPTVTVLASGQPLPKRHLFSSSVENNLDRFLLIFGICERFESLPCVP